MVLLVIGLSSFSLRVSAFIKFLAEPPFLLNSIMYLVLRVFSLLLILRMDCFISFLSWPSWQIANVFKSITKAVPYPRAVNRVTEPPISSISCLHMLRPRPTPSLFWLLCSFSLARFIKIVSFFSSEMPGPWS